MNTEEPPSNEQRVKLTRVPTVSLSSCWSSSRLQVFQAEMQTLTSAPHGWLTLTNSRLRRCPCRTQRWSVFPPYRHNSHERRAVQGTLFKNRAASAFIWAAQTPSCTSHWASVTINQDVNLSARHTTKIHFDCQDYYSLSLFMAHQAWHCVHHLKCWLNAHMKLFHSFPLFSTVT